MIAIDGSNRWIWNNPDINARIAIIRTAYAAYQYSKVTDPNLQLQKQDSRDEAVLITPDLTSTQDTDIDHARFHQEIQKIVGRKNPIIETLSILRTLNEFKLAETVAIENQNSLIVMDGALTYVQIKELTDTIQNIRKACKKNNNILIGISKRNTTRKLRSEMTDEAVIREKAKSMQRMMYVEIERVPKPKRIFPPLGRIFLAKLHEKPVKTFRVDIDLPPNENIENVMSHLAHYSKIDTFPGYPFPLVDAHTIAVLVRRVPDMYNHEIVEAGLEIGLTEDDLLQYMITHENLEKDPFHRYLDEATR
jgi:hypothetical protein